MAKPQSLSKEAQEYLKKNSYNMTVSQIREMFGLSYNSAVHYLRWNGLPFKRINGTVKKSNPKLKRNLYDKCPITGW